MDSPTKLSNSTNTRRKSNQHNSYQNNFQITNNNINQPSIRITSEEQDYYENLLQNNEVLKKDDELYDLHRQYTIKKKERLKIQKNHMFSKNKLKLLQAEESKTYRKLNQLKSSQEDLNNIKISVKQNKNYINDVKMQREKILEEKRNKIRLTKESTSYNMKNWRNNIVSRNQSIHQNLTRLKSENKQKIKENNDRKLNLNKNYYIKVKTNKMKFEDNKNQNILSQKDKQIAELNKKIQQEDKLVEDYANKIDSAEKKEFDLINRISKVNLNQINEKKKFSCIGQVIGSNQIQLQKQQKQPNQNNIKMNINNEFGRK